MTAIAIATQLMLMALTCSGVCLMECSTMPAGQPALLLPTLPSFKERADDNKITRYDDEIDEKMFPDGLMHDFGMLPMGIKAYHAFRIVNTSDVPLRISSVRFG